MKPPKPERERARRRREEREARKAARPVRAGSPPAADPTAPRRRRTTALALVAVALGLAVTATAVLLQRRGPREVPILGHEVVTRYPHDPAAYCQGLIYQGGKLLESTGKYGLSTLRRVKLETGEVEESVSLSSTLFGEGLTEWKGKLIQLTWRGERALVYDAGTLELKEERPYEGEGWGLTHDGRHLIMSDGSDTLRFLDPENFREVRRLPVTADGQPVVDLNELEYVQGRILANVWHSNRIARIDPKTGKVAAWIDLTGLQPPGTEWDEDNVLNGIAYDAKGKRLFVTGKRWPLLYQIRVKE